MRDKAEWLKGMGRGLANRRHCKYVSQTSLSNKWAGLTSTRVIHLSATNMHVWFTKLLYLKTFKYH